MKSVILPLPDWDKPLISLPEMKRAIDNALTGTAKAIRVDFNVTTQTWKKRPTFSILIRGSSLPEGQRIISTMNEIYAYVNYGTKPHTIRPKYANKLAFQSGYTNKTVPNRIASRPGGSFGPTVFANEVKHPGTKARNFDRAIARKWRKEWPRNLQRAINSVAVR